MWRQQLIKTVKKKIKTKESLVHCKGTSRDPSLWFLQPCVSSSVVPEPILWRAWSAMVDSYDTQALSKSIPSCRALLLRTWKNCHLCCMTPTLDWFIQFKLFDMVLSTLVRNQTVLWDLSTSEYLAYLFALKPQSCKIWVEKKFTNNMKMSFKPCCTSQN